MIIATTTKDQFDNVWGDIAQGEHLVQIYGDDSVFLDSLEGYVGAGLSAGHGVIVIGTQAHLISLAQRLRERGFDLREARWRDQFIPLEAEGLLQKIMVKEWPDDQSFDKIIHELLERAGQEGRKVRVFGEMVSLLWSRGQCGATVRLEHLWDALCRSKILSRFCAYPRACFTQNIDTAIRVICDTHTRVIPG